MTRPNGQLFSRAAFVIASRIQVAEAGCLPIDNMSALRFLLLMAASAFLSGCAGPQTALVTRPGTDKPPVRSVDFSRAPEARELAERARQLGNAVYPKILAILDDDPAKLPQRFDIVLRPRVDKGQHGGKTVGNKIYLPANRFAATPSNLDLVLVHEMAHVAQGYHWYNWFTTPWYWREGIAAYVQYKLGYGAAPYCAQCSTSYPHYTSGYWCAGAFLLYVDATYGSNAVRRLYADMRAGSYAEAALLNATGKSLKELWAEFQKTAAFSPLAAEAARLSEALGYANRKPPRNLQMRFEAYLRRRTGGPDTLEAREFLVKLMSKGQQPGWAKDERGEMSYGIQDGVSSNSPVTRTFHGQKEGDCSTFHYTVVRVSRETGWKLQRAWQTAPDGAMIKEFPIQ